MLGPSDCMWSLLTCDRVCVGLGLVWVMPCCASDLTTATFDLKDEHPDEFGDAGASTQGFGLFVFAFSCGTFLGPVVAGVIKSKLDWGAATVILACVCAVACVPIVSDLGPWVGRALTASS